MQNCWEKQTPDLSPTAIFLHYFHRCSAMLASPRTMPAYAKIAVSFVSVMQNTNCAQAREVTLCCPKTRSPRRECPGTHLSIRAQPFTDLSQVVSPRFCTIQGTRSHLAALNRCLLSSFEETTEKVEINRHLVSISRLSV